LQPPNDGTYLDFTCPDWSPDGTRIAARATNFDTFIVSMAADGSDLRFHGRVGTGDRNGCPRWSPDGSLLAMAVRYSGFNTPATLPARPDPWVWGTNNMVITTWSTAVDDASSPGAVLATISGPAVGIEAVPHGASWTPDGSALLVGMEGTGACGTIRVEADGSGTTRAMNCPTLRKPNLAGTTLVRVGGFVPSNPQLAPDGRIAFASGYVRSFSDYTFAPTLCTVPGDSSADPPDPFADQVTPGLSCVVGPGALADLPLTGSVNGKVQIDWSAGPILDGDGGSSGVVVIPEEPPPSPADAGGPYAATQFEPVVLDAGASGLLAGPDGNAAVVEWDLDDDGLFDDAAGVRPEVSFPESGSFAVRVRITPPGGSLQVSAPSTVEVAAAPAPAPVVAPDATAPNAPVLTPVDLEVVVPADGEATVTLRTAEGAAVPFVVRTVPDPSETTVSTANPVSGAPSVPFDVPADGRLLVRAGAGFLGTTSFTYGLTPDGRPVATVTVRVIGVGQPLAGADSVDVVSGELAVVDPADLLANDRDAAVELLAASSSLEIVSVFGGQNVDAWLGADGSINVVGGSPGSGSFRYVIAGAGGAIATGDVAVSILAAGGSSTVPASTTPASTVTEPPDTTVVPVAPTVSPPGAAPTDSVAVTTTIHPLDVELPATGTDVMRTSDIAAALVAIGIGVLLIGRARRRSTPVDE
jgi:hypothetical protein